MPSRQYTDSNKFQQVDYTENAFEKGEYENCSFIGCNFMQVDLSESIFENCTFAGCNLSMAGLQKVAFRDVKFTDSKMLGLRFEQCNPFGLAVQFDQCILHHASFFQMRLQKCIFRHCDMIGVDFAEADLTSVVFDYCNLAGTVFDNTNLEKADLRTSFDYSISPSRNKIKKAKFSYPGVLGLLKDYNIDIDM